MKKILIFFISIIWGCKSIENPVTEILPSVTTNNATNISTNNVTLNGEVKNEGTFSVIERGFVYSDKNIDPSLNDNKVVSGFGIGRYFTTIYNLLPNTKYYYKAYLKNSKGNFWGEIKNFTTLASIVTSIPYLITYSTALVQGEVLDVGGSDVTERGFCFSQFSNPTINDTKIIVSLNGAYIDGRGFFSINIYGLKNETKYFLRAYAINSNGVSYGNEQIFNTLKAPLVWYDNYTEVVEIKSKTGRIWMDRNLGASRVAQTIGDNASFGDLYQWGRRTDGHQKRDSGIIEWEVNNLAQPQHGLFSTYPDGWIKPMDYSLWQGVDGQNNPCPKGFRLPTKDEWDQERASWISKDSNGAFLSPLKLPSAGYRNTPYKGRIEYEGSYAMYHSSTVNFPEGYFNWWGLSIKLTNAEVTNGPVPYYGYCVRCIKN